MQDPDAVGCGLFEFGRVSSAPPMPVPSVFPGSASQPTFIATALKVTGSRSANLRSASFKAGSMCSANTLRTS